MTFGSEAWDCSNVILRNCSFAGTGNIVLFKMRPDTPQKYGNVLVENVTGTPKNGIRVAKWMQFYNLLDRPDMPRSGVSNVTLRNVDVRCTKKFYDVQQSDKYEPYKQAASGLLREHQGRRPERRLQHILYKGLPGEGRDRQRCEILKTVMEYVPA